MPDFEMSAKMLNIASCITQNGEIYPMEFLRSCTYRSRLPNLMANDLVSAGSIFDYVGHRNAVGCCMTVLCTAISMMATDLIRVGIQSTLLGPRLPASALIWKEWRESSIDESTEWL